MNNPYAWAIQPIRIANRINCALNEVELIEEERQNFEGFCLQEAERERTYPNQIEAWAAYDRENHIESILKETKIVIDVEPKPEPTWEDELKQDFDKRAQFGNYNETGGQQ